VSALIGKDTTEYLDTSNYLFAAGQYWYLVQAINYTGMVSGYSVPAASRPDKTLTVDAPRSFFGYQDGKMARLFWSRTDDFAVAGYHLYRAREADSLKWEKLTAIALPRTAGDFTDTTAAMDASWRYQLRAVDDKGVESQPTHDVRIALFEAAPLPPGNIRIAAVGGSLKVIWSKSLQTSAFGYHVYRRSDTEGPVLLTAQPIPNATTEFVDRSVRAGVKYYFSICCVDRSGREGDRSPEVSYLNK
jgi:fibronectin type 3 domain-containing protein